VSGTGVGREVKMWDVASAEERASVAVPAGYASAIAITPAGKTLAVAGGTGILLVNVKTKEQRIISRRKTISVALAPDGHTVAGGGEGFAQLWDVRTGMEVLFIPDTLVVWSVTFSPDGTPLATGTGQRARLWDLATGELRATFVGHHGVFCSVAFSPDGRTLAMAN